MPKIFGIGLQRTGTTSLHVALKILGYRTIHGPFALYPDPAPDFMADYDAFSDNPIPLLYQKLDSAYPGSKFILTTRHPDGWIESVRWLFNTGRIEGNWQADSIIDEIHNALYGTTRFDENIFREVWHAYHEDVLRYFSDRPEDLLTVDFSGGDKWGKLCTFLDREIPPVDFPRSNEASWIRTLIAPARYLVKRIIGWKLSDYNMKR